ncbi:polysaccharide deacetylase family protein [Flavobacteriaceae bacterium GSB9]|nr:polysaccharide deacetylase family protein [Flavobacteriaceae bacterium GSB9]
MFPNYVWDVPNTKKNIYLTFDDGPTPEITNWTLNVLKQYNAKATFFCIGNNVEKHPKILKGIIEQGHSVGNHTQNHLKGWNSKTDAYIAEVDEAQKIIDLQKPLIVNHQPSTKKLFRPPYGKIKPKQGQKLIDAGYKIIMWDVISFDWDTNITPEACLDNVIYKATEGSIVVFHDSVKASKNMQFALPKVLDFFSQKGYSFKSLKF